MPGRLLPHLQPSDCVAHRNVALVEEQHIQFQPGLNVITGESGAGKSILVTALGLALGSAASSDTIRTPAKQAAVEATFSLQGHGQVQGPHRVLLMQSQLLRTLPS